MCAATANGACHNAMSISESSTMLFGRVFVARRVVPSSVFFLFWSSVTFVFVLGGFCYYL